MALSPRARALSLCVLAASVVSVACGAPKKTGGGSPSPVVPAGSRVLALEVNPPATLDYGQKLALAQSAGALGLTLTMPWSFLEPTNGKISVAYLKVGMDTFRAAGSKVLLSIPTLDTTSKEVPADLAGVAMDDPAMISRFSLLLDSALSVCGPELQYLEIGNEVNIYLNGHPQSEWDAYKTFVDAGVAHVHQLRPDVKVGISASFQYLPSAQFTTLDQSSDVLSATYYLIGNVFGGGGNPATNVHDDFDTLVAAAGSKPLVMKECGYPTGSADGGSNAGQQQFVQDVFAAWDAHATKIPFLVYSRMYDGQLSDCQATAAAYGMPGNEAFIEFLCTLGLRDVGDVAKPAWSDFEAQAAARGFH